MTDVSSRLTGLVAERLGGLPEGTRQAILARVESELPDFIADVVDRVVGDERSRSQSSLRQQYEHELGEVRRGNVAGVVALQRKYRRRGLDV
jgi:hypothetical protein